MTTIDVFTAEIVRNALTSASLEMNKTLRRTAYNPLLYDVQDFGLGIVSADGLLWGEAPGQSMFIGALLGHDQDRARQARARRLRAKATC